MSVVEKPIRWGYEGLVSHRAIVGHGSQRGRSGQLNEKRLHRTKCLAMIKRRCRQASMENADLLCNHTFQGTGITAYLRNEDSKLEHAQKIAGHSDPKTTLLYDQRSDEIITR